MKHVGKFARKHDRGAGGANLALNSLWPKGAKTLSGKRAQRLHVYQRRGLFVPDAVAITKAGRFPL